MAKYCCPSCKMICDFCRYYIDDNNDGEFTGDGVCDLTNEDVFADGNCDRFECKNIKD